MHWLETRHAINTSCWIGAPDCLVGILYVVDCVAHVAVPEISIEVILTLTGVKSLLEIAIPVLA